MSAATDFLGLMLRGQSTLVAIHPETGLPNGIAMDRNSLAAADTWLTLHREFNLYWTPNAVAGRIGKKPTKDQIARLHYVHLDLDDPSDAVLKRLRDYKLPPTIIVFSGGGYQAFWELSDPPLVNGNAELLEAANRRVIADLGGDVGTHNLDRLMRLPGTTNWPTAKKRAKGRVPVEARLIEHHPERTYALADFGAAPSAPSPAPALPPSDDWPALEQYDNDGSRHLLACVRVARLRNKLTRPTIHKLFDDHPHALDQNDPVRAVDRCIDLVDAGQPAAGDVLEGITDSRVVSLLRPFVEAGAVVIGSDHVPNHTVARIALRAMRDRLYSQSGQPVELVRGELKLVKAEGFVSRVSVGRRVVKVHTSKQNNILVGESNLPVSQATMIFASLSVLEELRQIELVVERPIAVEHEGQLVMLRPGYNDCAVFVLGGDPIPEVNLEDATAALLALLEGFQFAATSDHSRAVAALILPALVMGRMLNGHAPIIFFEGDREQAGKGLMSQVGAATYGEHRQLVTQKSQGGVGSLEEMIGERLLRGKPFINLDNFRGTLNLPSLEALITAGADPFPVRVPFRGLVNVDIRRFIIQLTSNGVELTPDLAHRLLVVRLVRRPDGYEFHQYMEGSLLAHVQRNQSYYAGCVYAVVRRWFDAGKPHNRVLHTFEEMGALDWIAQNVFRLPPLLNEHQEIVARLSSHEDSFMRSVVNEMERQERLRRDVLASALVDLARDAGLVPTGGWPLDGDEANRHMGKILAQVFKKGEVRDFGHLRIRRSKGTCDSRPAKWYCVWRPADGPPPDFVDDEAPL